MSTEPYRPSPEEVLHHHVARYTAAGYRVESLIGRTAVMASGSECNHILHALLTFLFTCGLWAPVWIVLAVTQKVQRSTITVNEQCQVFVTHG